MISLVRGPGGLLKRLADDFVPLGIAIAVGGIGITVLDPLHAALLGALAWPFASLLLRAVRRRPWLRRLYRLALLAHVLFWSAQGFLLDRVAPSEAPQVAASHAWAAPAPLRAGYGEADFALPDWATLAGWGAPPRRLRLPAFGGLGPVGRAAQAWMAEPDGDGRPRVPMFHAAERNLEAGPLQHPGARVLVLEPGASHDGARLVVVRLDLVTSARSLHAALLERLAPDGISADRLLVCATHTHSGPGGYSDNPVSAVFGTDHHSAVLERAIVDAAAIAYGRALTARVPARIGLVRARDRDPESGSPVLARNRRGDEDAVDDRVYALRVDARDGGPLAVLLNYAVHPYLYRRRHLEFERDLAGGLEQALEARLPGAPKVLFVNGAQGDVSTRHGGGAPAERIQALAARFADTIAPAIEAASMHDELRVATARVERRLGTPRAFVALAGSRAGVVETLDRRLVEMRFAATVADALALPLNLAVWSLAIPEARVGFTWEGDVGARILLEPSMGNPPQSFSAWVFELGAKGATRFALMAEPGEAMQALGRAWRDAAARRELPDALVLGLTNGSMAYMTPSADFGQEGYEYDSTLFGPSTGDDVSASLELALDAALEALGR